jgi:signal recognition particle subunit SRP54
MFENLSDRLNKVFADLRRRGKLTQADVDEGLRSVRLALLEADVHFDVVKDLLARIRERAIGAEVSKALNPGQQVIKIVNEELVQTLGEAAPLNLKGAKPRTVMMVGLQGAGKTTTAAKLASMLRKEGERVLLVAADPYRPAAIDQLQTLGKTIGVEVFASPGKQPAMLAAQAMMKASMGGFSAMIIDTAGRSQLDDAMMRELRDIAGATQPIETLLVVDSMIGQEAVNVAQGFSKAVDINGLILTKIDGDARGGAAISLRAVTGVPIKYLGVGEGLTALEVFDPTRVASRILGMGDVIGLIEKAESALDAKNAEEQAEKMLSGDFTLEDFASQLRQVRSMGPIGQLLDMMPNMPGNQRLSQNIDNEAAEKMIKKTEAIISSMTVAERQRPKKIITASRKRRIATGSGTTQDDVNRVLKQYYDMQKMMKRMKKSGMRGFPGMM